MFAIRLLTALSLAATCAAQGLDVRLHQYDWPLSDGSIIEYSRAGSFELMFDDDDDQLLAANGGGFVNIVMLDNYTGDVNWLVRNLHVSFSSDARMHEMPYLVQFGMGDVNGLPWGTSVLSTSVSARPSRSMPIDYIQVVDAEPTLYPLTIGGWVDSDADSRMSAVSADPNQVALDSMGGVQGPDGDPKIVCAGGIADLPGGCPAPSASGNDCAPAAIAGSIAYMAKLHNRPVPPVQDIFKGLKDCMGTDATGTKTGAMLSGKNAYTCNNELPICSEILEGLGWGCVAANALQMGGDVEVMYRKGPCGAGGAGHVAMIRGIAVFEDGTMVIETMEPVTAPDGSTSWVTTPIIVSPGGEMIDATTGQVAGCLHGFFVELWQAGCVCAG